MTYPDAAALTDQTQYAIANDGYPLALAETNGVSSGGLINYKTMPGS